MPRVPHTDDVWQTFSSLRDYLFLLKRKILLTIDDEVRSINYDSWRCSKKVIREKIAVSALNKVSCEC